MVSRTLENLSLHTVCQEAHCPNQMECYGHGTATFLLLGPNCTRGCTFCTVGKHKVAKPDPQEPVNVAQAVKEMGLDFCVITMVTRDDMPDGGAEHVAQTIRAVRELNPDTGIEVLISDLGGDPAALEKVLEARPEVLNHNIETIPRLYPTVRPQADFQRSIELLARSARYSPRPVTKSGLMVGLGRGDGRDPGYPGPAPGGGLRSADRGPVSGPQRQTPPRDPLYPARGVRGVQDRGREKGLQGRGQRALCAQLLQGRGAVAGGGETAGLILAPPCPEQGEWLGYLRGFVMSGVCP